VTFEEAYTSLKSLYKKLMFAENRWSMKEIDEMDMHFFHELIKSEKEEQTVYIDQVW